MQGNGMLIERHLCRDKGGRLYNYSPRYRGGHVARSFFWGNNHGRIQKAWVAHAPWIYGILLRYACAGVACLLDIWNVPPSYAPRCSEKRWTAPRYIPNSTPCRSLSGSNSATAEWRWTSGKKSSSTLPFISHFQFQDPTGESCWSFDSANPARIWFGCQSLLVRLKGSGIWGFAPTLP